MNMQTGPAPRQPLDRWLLWTGILEIVNIFVFGYLWWIVNWMMPGEDDLLSLLGYFTLSAILLEGGVYWLLARGRFFQRAPAGVRLRLLRGAYWLNGILLAAFPAGVIARLIQPGAFDPGDFWFGLAFYTFGFGEFLHYFVFKINMRLSEWERAVATKQLVPARVLRELRRAEVACQTKNLTGKGEA